MKNYRFLLIIAIVVMMGLVMVASVSAQDQDRLQLKDGSCLEDGSVCPNPDCDGEPDQLQIRIGGHWAE